MIMKKFIIILFLLLTSTFSFSQSNKTTVPSTTQVTSSPVEDPGVTETVRNLELARRSENLTAKTYWENKLHELTNSQTVNNTITGITGRKGSGTVGNLMETINLTRITGDVVVANSISRERVTGVIYAALGVYGGPANSDTLKIYKSTNNGLNFDFIYAIGGTNLRITNNAIDCEAVSKGDSTFAFIGMSISAGPTSLYNSVIIRVRQDGVAALPVGVVGSATMKYTNARITSDNANYTNSTYIYLTLTQDSIASGRHLIQKFYRIENPFGGAMQLITGYQNPALAGTYAYYVDGAAPDTANYMTDIAYVNTTGGASQLYTVTVVRGVPGVYGDGSSLHFSRSTTYGATAPTLFFTTEPDHLKDTPRLASTGLTDNSIMVITKRLYAGGDWDPYTFYTPDITVAAPVFTKTYVDQSSDTTRGVSLTAKYRSPGVYLTGYSNRYQTNNGGKIYVRLFSAGTFNPAANVNPAGIIATGLFGLPDVTFRNVSGDSTLAIWSGIGGIACYVTGGTTGATVGIENPNLNLNDFQLGQNYPNPFNPSTNISFIAKTSALVKIVVYDNIGNEVAELMNERKDEGIYNYSFDGKNLSSGVYYYRITFTSSDSKSFTQTRKMILMK